jgi:hypothetical protein
MVSDGKRLELTDADRARLAGTPDVPQIAERVQAMCDRAETDWIDAEAFADEPPSVRYSLDD